MKALLRCAVLLVSAIIAAHAAPAVSPDQPDLLQREILAAYRAGLHRIVVPPGTYRIKPQAEGSHLQFRNLTDFD